jgi:glycosyltransferase domain-containing protein
MSLEQVSIIIPTCNRPRELRRLLSFLDKFHRVSQILVLDGSKEENKSMNRALAARNSNTVYVPYDSQLHLGLRLADGLRRVQTEFCVVCGDDDFVFPLALERCVRFLTENSDYSAAIGWVKTMEYHKQGRLRRGFALGEHLEHGGDIKHDQFCHRVLNYFAYTHLGFVPLYYSVRRTRQVVSASAFVRSSMKYSSCELLNVLLVLLEGKLRVLPIVYGIRDYSSEPTLDPERHDPLTYYTEQDVAYIRDVMMHKMIGEYGFDEKTARYTLDLQLIGNEYVLDRPPETSTRARMAIFFKDLQCIGAILRPKLMADYLGIDHSTYSALRRVHAEFYDALPDPDNRGRSDSKECEACGVS